MAVAVSGFNKDRLVQARCARGLTAVSLADLINVSQSTISLYEKGTQKPRQEILDRLAQALNVPPTYFLKDVSIEKPSRLFYRSMSAATKAARTRVEARYEWALEVVNYLLEFFTFPELRLPEFDLPDDFRQLEPLMIESMAEQLRQHWTLGRGPIDNIVRTLESNGIIVWRTPFEAETLDAFSECRKPHPMVILSSDKQNYFRSRFDAAHELGHLVLHRTLDKRALNKSTDFKIVEGQAHHFAAAFLLPAVSYSDALWDVSLDTFRALKPGWKVSIALQIKRCRQLGLITAEEEKRLWINLSRRKWRESEPLDTSTPAEKPELIAKGVKLLVNEKVRTGEQLAIDLHRYAFELERLCELEPGFLSGAEVEPVLKRVDNKVVPFRR